MTIKEIKCLSMQSGNNYNALQCLKMKIQFMPINSAQQSIKLLLCVKTILTTNLNAYINLRNRYMMLITILKLNN